MYQKIVVPLDGSKLAECVLPHVEAISRGCGVKEVILFRVVPKLEDIPQMDYYDTFISVMREDDIGKAQEDAKKNAQKYLNDLKGKLNWPGCSVKTKIAIGSAPEKIADYVEKNSVDLVVIATHGRSGVSRFVWGSVADRLLRSICAPVLMVRVPGCITGI